MNAPDWLASYAEKLGIPAPTKDELTAVLDLAGEAAHASQRIAAPVATWLVGRSGLDLEEAMRLAREVAGESDPTTKPDAPDVSGSASGRAAADAAGDP